MICLFQLNEKCTTKFEILNKELEEKDSTVDRLNYTIKAKDETIKYFSVNNVFKINYHNQGSNYSKSKYLQR